MSRSASDPALLTAAAALAARVNLAAPITLAALQGGQNNRVFAVQLVDGQHLILKAYFADPRDTRDRLGAEWAFLTYAWARGVRGIPEPLACDPETRLGLYTHLPGAKIPQGGVEAGHVDAALDFVLAVNAPPRYRIKALPPASEACFSAAAHIATVERRVRALDVLDPSAPMRAEAERLVTVRLAPIWSRVRAQIERAISKSGVPLEATLDPGEEIVSPSDFGFHNALLYGNRLSFLDFEYAGRDDPAKFVCDFFCQPEIPVPTSYFQHVVERVVDGLSLPEAHKERCVTLLDLYRVKWACIILNHFLPLGAARRSFADPNMREIACATQLMKASAKLDEIDA